MVSGIDITCVVPVKNGGLFFGECLASIRSQNFRGKFEVCVYDDGSTDGVTEDIISEFRRIFPEFSFISRRGEVSGGVGFAKNVASRLGHGRFLCFCDADDISEPYRLQIMFDYALSLPDPDICLLGSRCRREPEGSTERFTRWANEIEDHRLLSQMYTSHGPPLIAPTWFMGRRIFELTNGFNQDYVKGFPEDLDFFYRAVSHGAIIGKVDQSLVIYRYHPGCETFSVKEETIWDIRIRELQKRVLSSWDSFTVWSAGKQGKRFFKSLSPTFRSRVRAFCDVDAKKIRRGFHEEFDPVERRVTWRVPILDVSEAQGPFVICVKQDLTEGDLERIIEEKNLIEGADYIHFG